MVLALKQLALARPVRGHLLLDGVRKVEFNSILLYHDPDGAGEKEEAKTRTGGTGGQREDGGLRGQQLSEAGRMFGPVAWT